MDQFRAKRGYICDMDGVIYHGNRLLPGVKEFVNWLYQEGKQFLFLTNNPGHDTARDVTELRGLSKSQVSAAVDLLAERGLLDRLPDRADRRVVHLALTEAGAALARQGRQIQSACLEKLFSGLTPAETDRFQQLLEKVLTGAETQLREGANT